MILNRKRIPNSFCRNFPARAKQMPSKVLIVGKKKRRPLRSSVNLTTSHLHFGEWLLFIFICTHIRHTSTRSHFFKCFGVCLRALFICTHIFCILVKGAISLGSFAPDQYQYPTPVILPDSPNGADLVYDYGSNRWADLRHKYTPNGLIWRINPGQTTQNRLPPTAQNGFKPPTPIHPKPVQTGFSRLRSDIWKCSRDPILQMAPLRQQKEPMC